MTPLLPMYTLGHDFVPPSIHAGGLRYHGDSPIISKLVKTGAWRRSPTRRARRSRPRCSSPNTEGKLPAPETGHAIRAVDRRGARGQGNGRGAGHPVQLLRPRPPRPAGVRRLPARPPRRRLNGPSGRSSAAGAARPRLPCPPRVVGGGDEAAHRLAHAHRVLPCNVRAAMRHLVHRAHRERRALAEAVGEPARLDEQVVARHDFQASPISCARAASIRSPVSSSSSACCIPTRGAAASRRRSSGTPRRTSGIPNSASSAAITKSQALTAVSP